VFADENGNREGREAIAGQDLCVIMLAARSNHPLGALAPGYKQVGDFMKSFVEDLGANSEKYGFLGASSWLSAADRAANSEQMGLLYFKSVDHMHEWAHGPLHQQAMNWWKKDYDKWAHIGLMHEVFSIPKKGWEGVYNNYHPTGLTATSTPAVIKTEQGERKMFVSPMVYGNGPLKYSRARMNRSLDQGEEELLDSLISEKALHTSA
jgi:hypothetical protein